MLKKYIPDFITSLNIVCGIAGVVFAFRGRCDLALMLMLAAGVFDFCDGLAARSLHAYSDLGKELDSLCDLVSFGVLPGVMLHITSRSCMMSESWVCWTPLLIPVFSALRLAKFNVDERQKSGFLGLPTPACALLVGSLCYFVAYHTTSFLAVWMAGKVFVPVLSICLCALLVCEMPMFSFKFHKDDPKLLKVKRCTFIALMLVSVIICIIFKLNWSIAVLLSLSCYVIKNVIYWIAGLK